MKLKGTYEKQVLHVGLSEELPLRYSGADEKYSLADMIARPATVHYVRERMMVEIEATTDELLVQTPERMRCYRLVSTMPVSALPEVEESLLELQEHYLSIAAAEQRSHLLPAPVAIQPTVSLTVKT